MTESKELHQKVDKILQRVESMDNLMPWMIRPQAKEIRTLMLDFFKNRVSTARVYLEIDGQRSVNDMVNHLKMKQPNVSREITILSEMALIEPKSIGNTRIYKKAKIDKIIGLSKALEKMLSKTK